jgi:hypothetical protein
MTQKIFNVIVALGLVVVGFMAFKPDATQFGAVTNNITHSEQGVWWFSNTHYFGSTQQTSVSSAGAVTIGATGTATAGDQWGTCSLIAPSFTVAASTTVPMDCAVTGAVSTDFVLTQFATSSANGQGWSIKGAAASTTSGFVTLRVANETGTSAIIPASIASSTKYLIRR